MADLNPSTVPPSQRPPAPGRGRRGLTLAALLGLPAAGVAAILTGIVVPPGGGDCGGPLPGCGNLRNAGEAPVTVQATHTDGTVTTSTVPPGQRGVLTGVTNAVAVEPGTCLTVDAGPFWTATTHVSTPPHSERQWVPIDDWGARVQVATGFCPEDE